MTTSTDTLVASTAMEIHTSTMALSNSTSMDSTASYYAHWCPYYKKMLTFNSTQLTRVILTWTFFVISTCGNCFVLYCLLKRNRRLHIHVITIHLTLADLAFTVFSMPMDAIWNMTMSWLGGEFLCRLCQLLKQFGMYISSFMVVVIALDRVFSIVLPMANNSKQQKRTKILLITAWSISLLCSIPPAFLFSIVRKKFCPDEPEFEQCIDFLKLSKDQLKPYYFFTMCVSFIIPLFFTVVSYSLILSEIRDMQLRDERITGRRDSNIVRARRKTLFLTSTVTLSFIVLWGPYYAMGIYHWFNPKERATFPKEISLWLFLLMYIHPTVHPVMYGFFMKDIRKQCLMTFSQCFKLSRLPRSRQASKQLSARDHHLPADNSHCRAARAASSPLLGVTPVPTTLRAASVPFIQTDQLNKTNNTNASLGVPPQNGSCNSRTHGDEML
uniref:Gonadotropin-releasing hormone receptor 3a n=1 Tax=Ciona savignyi TaxID=51511 RepID=A9XBF8_CIOSA|nr:gonadotropin-releasing hormone receptor 3a [Ciona savignyi]